MDLKIPFEDEMGRVVNEVILQRTGMGANLNDSIIYGCGECVDNLAEPSVWKLPPTHKCRLTGQLILDPFNIPRWCPRQIEDGEVK